MKEETNFDIKKIRVNNCFSGATKDALELIKKEWEDAKKDKITGISLVNYNPVAASDNNIIFTTEDESLANLFNSSVTKIEKALKKHDINVKVISLTDQEWLEEKKKYIENKKNNISYEYVEEPKKTEGTSKLKEEVNKIFEDKDVEIA